MSLRRDNSGLTLVSATHVFLAEPSFSQAVEAQAINRVHRIGQTNQTYVHKFVICNSIEHKIVQMQDKTKDSATLVARQEKEEIRVQQLLDYLDLKYSTDQNLNSQLSLQFDQSLQSNQSDQSDQSDQPFSLNGAEGAHNINNDGGL